MPHKPEDENEPLELWAPAIGTTEGTPGNAQFLRQAAQILTTMPASVLFSSSKATNGAIETASPVKNGDAKLTVSISTGESVDILISNDKVVNLVKPDGNIDKNVLSACFTKLATTPVVIPADDPTRSNAGKFNGITGADRLLDFMSKKAKDFREKEAANKARKPSSVTR